MLLFYSTLCSAVEGPKTVQYKMLHITLVTAYISSKMECAALITGARQHRSRSIFLMQFMRRPI